ncbi:MAG TPA: N-acetyltransferase [Gammaproteobacteria bacterium]|nr:N-acetyltransferase [Gammaproteobacteria bacterium]
MCFEPLTKKALAHGVLDIARGNGDKVIPKCPFVAANMRHHKETQDLLADPTYLEAHLGMSANDSSHSHILSNDL